MLQARLNLDDTSLPCQVYHRYHQRGVVVLDLLVSLRAIHPRLARGKEGGAEGFRAKNEEEAHSNLVLCGGCNMRVTLVELSQERDCHKCGKKIAVGEKAVKTVAGSSSCSVTEISSVYVHEQCWKPGAGKK